MIVELRCDVGHGGSGILDFDVCDVFVQRLRHALAYHCRCTGLYGRFYVVVSIALRTDEGEKQHPVLHGSGIES